MSNLSQTEPLLQPNKSRFVLFIVLQSIIYSTIFLFIFLFSFVFAQSSSNDNTLNCGPNQFLTIGSDGLKCTSISLGDIEIGVSLSSLSAVCDDGIRKLQVIDEGEIQGIIPNCVDIPVCRVNEVLSYTTNTNTNTDTFQCINVDTFSGTLCPPGHTLIRIAEGGIPACTPFALDKRPIIDPITPPTPPITPPIGPPIIDPPIGPPTIITLPITPPVDPCLPNRITNGFDEEGNPICSNLPEKTITVVRSSSLNVRSNNIAGIDCGNGKNRCVKSFPYGSDIELHLDVIGWAKKLRKGMNGECNFIKRSTTYPIGYKCEFQLYKNLTIQNQAENLRTRFIYSGPRKYEGETASVNTTRFPHVGVNDPFCIDVQATHFPDDAIFESTVSTKFSWKGGSSGTHRGHNTKLIIVKKNNTIGNPVTRTMRVEEDRHPRYKTWIAGDKICSTRGGYSHNSVEHSFVGFDTEWKIGIGTDRGCPSGQTLDIDSNMCVTKSCTYSGQVYSYAERGCVCLVPLLLDYSCDTVRRQIGDNQEGRSARSTTLSCTSADDRRCEYSTQPIYPSIKQDCSGKGKNCQEYIYTGPDPEDRR